MILTCSLCKIFKSISKLYSNWNSHYLIWNPHYSNWNPHYSNWNLHYSIWNPLLELEFTLLELEILTQDMCKGYTEKTAPVFIQNASSPIRFYRHLLLVHLLHFFQIWNFDFTPNITSFVWNFQKCFNFKSIIPKFLAALECGRTKFCSQTFLITEIATLIEPGDEGFKSIIESLTHLSPMFHFYTPWKYL